MECKPIYEFLVWDNCKNNCKFCFQREKPRLFNHLKRKFILDETLKFIDSDSFVKGSHILVVGGEIFDKPEDFEILLDFFTCIVDKMLNNTIDLLYINTNLIYTNVTGLLSFLELIKEHDLFKRLRFTTSYDLEGRFNDKRIFPTDVEDKTAKEVMLDNLTMVKRKYPDCQVVTNVILTKVLCQSILDKTFSVKEFMEKYACWINLIPYIIYDESMAADRNTIFRSLQVVDEENTGYLQRYITNLDLAQQKWLYMYKNDNFEFCSCELEDCGHAKNFRKYSDKGTCFICDIKEIFK